MYLIKDSEHIYIFERMKESPTKIAIKDINNLNVSYIYSNVTDYETALYRIEMYGRKDLVPCKVELQLKIV